MLYFVPVLIWCWLVLGIRRCDRFGASGDSSDSGTVVVVIIVVTVVLLCVLGGGVYIVVTNKGATAGRDTSFDNPMYAVTDNGNGGPGQPADGDGNYDEPVFKGENSTSGYLDIQPGSVSGEA